MIPAQVAPKVITCSSPCAASEETIRLISGRKATAKEKRHYAQGI
jgi:uncharacterized DUF497 family protein